MVALGFHSGWTMLTSDQWRTYGGVELEQSPAVVMANTGGPPADNLERLRKAAGGGYAQVCGE